MCGLLTMVWSLTIIDNQRFVIFINLFYFMKLIVGYSFPLKQILRCIKKIFEKWLNIDIFYYISLYICDNREWEQLFTFKMFSFLEFVTKWSFQFVKEIDKLLIFSKDVFYQGPVLKKLAKKVVMGASFRV